VIGFLLLGAIVNVAVAWAVPEIFWEKRTYTTYMPDGTSFSEERVVEDARGWPMRSFASKFPEPGGTYSRTIYNIHGIEISHHPIWPGFAINTVFYAVILWGLFAAPFALRRWRRMRRGLCPACAYPVGDSPVCTECGKAVPSDTPTCSRL
jgi:hypothetical protein